MGKKKEEAKTPLETENLENKIKRKSARKKKLEKNKK